MAYVGDTVERGRTFNVAQVALVWFVLDLFKFFSNAVLCPEFSDLFFQLQRMIVCWKCFGVFGFGLVCHRNPSIYCQIHEIAYKNVALPKNELIAQQLEL